MCKALYVSFCICVLHYSLQILQIFGPGNVELTDIANKVAT